MDLITASDAGAVKGKPIHRVEKYHIKKRDSRNVSCARLEATLERRIVPPALIGWEDGGDGGSHGKHTYIKATWARAAHTS